MCARHDHAALRELSVRYQKPVFGILLHTLSNHQDAEEAFADVFAKVWKYAGQFKRDAKITTWLYRIATNTARDYLRSRVSRRHIKVESLERSDGTTLEIASPAYLNPEESVIASVEHNRMLSMLSELSYDDRMLIVLHHLQEMDYDEVCLVTGIAPKNLKVRLFRARQQLRKLCEKNSTNDI